MFALNLQPSIVFVLSRFRPSLPVTHSPRKHTSGHARVSLVSGAASAASNMAEKRNNILTE